MYAKTVLCLTLVMLFYVLSGCSSSEGDDYKVEQKKVAKQEEHASLSGIQKKGLIEQSSLEKLTNIVSEYSNTTIDRDAVMIKIIELMNTPYLWGGTTSNGIDCSAFCQRVMKYALGIDLPRTSAMQSQVGEYVERENLQFGDLVFFNTRGRGVSHVGIYLGEGIFAHSSSSGGVKTNSLNEDYYNSRYLWARRVIK
ncbi:MAG: C40 family peptidase [Ignavibacteria bacterium]|nr:C40 family peptidase [Ignavibacteria bacterium]